MIELKNVRKAYSDNVVALKDINLTINNKEFVALLGPSGCGKSTTLNCIAGLLDPTSGAVIFDGLDVTELAPKDRNIGMVFQSYALYPHLSILDNIAFPLKQQKVSKNERRTRAKEMAKKLQIEQLLDRKPAELSGGQQQRVSMARALVKQPKVLLLDEPMSNLDARLKIEIREIIKQLQKEFDVTAIIVTHDQEEAMALADRIAILDGGEIQQYDTPEKLYNRPANLFVANFMGNPPMNFFDAAIFSNGGSLTFTIQGKEIPVPKNLEPKLAACQNKEVTIGARSHQLVPARKEDPNSLRFDTRNVENLGKELLVSGDFIGNHIRLTLDDTTNLPQYRKLAEEGSADHSFYFTITENINVFDKNDYHNLLL